MQYILIIIFALLFFPIKMEINLEKEGNNYFSIYFLRKRVKKINLKGKLEKIITYQITNKQAKLNKRVMLKSIKKLLKRLTYKEINLEYGVKLENYIAGIYLNVAITTLINCIIGSSADILKNSKISIKIIETNKVYTYKFNCIFTTNIANNIFVINYYILNIIKERWNLKWQSIQLKV